MRKQKLCANGTPRHTATGQTLYTINACKNPPLRGHILCETCRRETGYYVRQPVHRDKPVNEVRT